MVILDHHLIILLLKKQVKVERVVALTSFNPNNFERFPAFKASLDLRTNSLVSYF